MILIYKAMTVHPRGDSHVVLEPLEKLNIDPMVGRPIYHKHLPIHSLRYSLGHVYTMNMMKPRGMESLELFIMFLRQG